MEAKLQNHFEDLTVDESLEIDAGAFAVYIPIGIVPVLCYGIFLAF